MKKMFFMIFVMFFTLNFSVSAATVANRGTKQLSEHASLSPYVGTVGFDDLIDQGFQVLNFSQYTKLDSANLEFVNLFKQVVQGTNTDYYPLAYQYKNISGTVDAIVFMLIDKSKDISLGYHTDGSVRFNGTCRRFYIYLNKNLITSDATAYKNFLVFDGAAFKNYILMGDWFIDFLHSNDHFSEISNENLFVFYPKQNKGLSFNFAGHQINMKSTILFEEEIPEKPIDPDPTDPDPKPSYQLPYDKSIFESFVSVLKGILVAPLSVGIFLFSNFFFIAFLIRFFKKISR